MRLAVAPLTAGAMIVALTVSLGQWQLRRASEKDALALSHAAAIAAPPVRIGGSVDVAALDSRRIEAVGTFVPRSEVFLDNRTRNGVAGFHVLAPLRLEGEDARHVMVLRGWVARDITDRARLPAIPTPAGAVRIEGIAQAQLAQPMLLGEDPEPMPGQRLWQRYSAERYAAWSGLQVEAIVVRQTSALDDGLARDWVEPGSGADKHRAYALQWFGMALAAAIVAVMLAFRGRR